MRRALAVAIGCVSIAAAVVASAEPPAVPDNCSHSGVPRTGFVHWWAKTSPSRFAAWPLANTAPTGSAR